MKLHILLCLAAGLLLAADATDEQAAKKELKKLEGTWKIVSITREGNEQQPENVVSTVSDDKFTTKAGDRIVREGSLKIYPSQSPKGADATYTRGPDKGKTLKGIYELKGDTWKICYSAAGEERPKAFPKDTDKAYLILVLQREKR